MHLIAAYAMGVVFRYSYSLFRCVQ